MRKWINIIPLSSVWPCGEGDYWALEEGVVSGLLAFAEWDRRGGRG
jgi:hypothetical protein